MTPSAPCRILVIDDDASARLLVERVLKKLGHHVTVVDTAPAGTQALSAQDFDVVMADKNLDGADGLALLRNEKRRRPGTQVILMSGDGSAALIAQAKASGVEGFLEKPFNVARLKELLALALAGTGA